MKWYIVITFHDGHEDMEEGPFDCKEDAQERADDFIRNQELLDFEIVGRPS